MGLWIARHASRAAWKRVPWGMVWTVSLWLTQRGWERFQANLTQREQQELFDLVKKSRGRPGSLARRERNRLKDIAGKAIRG